MILEELNLVNFRNLQNQQTLKFSPGVNIFWGNNAQGKTNVLEAVYLLASAKSFRTRIDHELVTWGQEESRVTGKAGSFDIELSITRQNKELLINKQPKKLTDIIGSFVAVLFTPNDVALVSGAPLERRRFLDQLLSYLDKSYLHQLVTFNRVVRSRNQLFYQIAQGRKVDLEVWDEQLAKAASFIWQERLENIASLNKILKNLGDKLLKADLKIDYPLPFGQETPEKIKSKYLELLQEVRADEVQKKQTLYGPHRDNFKLILETQEADKIVSKDLGIYGSRGEQRSAALALKLAETQLLKEKRDLQPVLLLDEVLSELDDTHRQLLIRQVRSGQTFITTTSLESVTDLLPGKFASFQVENGLVKAD